jgi:hypothetical protein
VPKVVMVAATARSDIIAFMAELPCWYANIDPIT